MSGFDLFAPGAGNALALLGMRVTGLLLVAPAFSARNVPMPLRAGMTILFTALLAPVAYEAAGARGTSLELTVGAFLGEALIGFTIGLGAAILVGAAGFAGEIAGTQAGLSGAAIFDPLGGHDSTALQQFFGLFATVILFAVNGHLVMLDALATSVQRLPLGSALHTAAGLHALALRGGTLFALGLQFAAPAIAAIVLANTALAVLGRAAPQLNVLSVAFPLQIGIGLLTLGLAIPFLGMVVGDWWLSFGGRTGELLGILARGR
ncbi:MAG TPA: flagellar biosynthetic protein FliR [Gemmatimonadaceae bacterium]|nr:flagellar biosynthetic protein FliR [Gemmatimonadaceae bacterium]